MKEKKTPTPYEEAQEAANRKLDSILAELDEQLRGWTPKEAR